jgi:hypothetical protein
MGVHSILAVLLFDLLLSHEDHLVNLCWFEQFNLDPEVFLFKSISLTDVRASGAVKSWVGPIFIPF